MRILPLVLLPLVALAAGPVIVLASAPPRGDAPFLVVSGWGSEAEARVLEAGGRIVGPMRAPLGVFATSDDPGFARALRAAGAWAVIDGGRIAALCGV